MGKNSQSDKLNCPACNSANLGTFRFNEGLIYRCPNCKLEWADKSEIITVKSEDFTGVHKHYMDPESFSSDSYPPFMDFFQCLEKRFGKKPLRILDVGCGNGLFIKSEAGWTEYDTLNLTNINTNSGSDTGDITAEPTAVYGMISVGMTF